MKLYPFQQEGATWLANRKRAYLADEMGLGKTVQAVVACKILCVQRVLVICPASAIENWKREWRKWWPGGPTPSIVSYSKLIREVDYWQGSWDVVILDEAHYCKTPGAKRTRAALGIAAKAKRAWLLSGTPTPNNVSELWAPIKYLWPKVAAFFKVSTAFEWMDKFTHWTATDFGARPYANKNPEKLRPILRKLMKRRHWRGVGLQLPPLRIDTICLEPDANFGRNLEAQTGELRARPFQAALKYLQEEAEDGGHISRLRRYLGEYKAPRIGEIIAQELRDGAYDKIVVLAYHLGTIGALTEELREFNPVGFTGQTPPAIRQRQIDAFTNYPDNRVFLAQQKAAGVSINLQVTHELVLVEPAWSPEENFQAIKRIHRIGQGQPCRARIFTVPGTLDDAIMRVLAEKIRMLDEIYQEE